MIRNDLRHTLSELYLNPRGYLAEILNVELFRDILAFLETCNPNKLLEHQFHVPDYNDLKTRGENFSRRNNLMYAGELLERFKEREIVKDSKDLFTLTFTALVYETKCDLETVGEQLTDFYVTVAKELQTNFNFHTALTLLANAPKLFEVDEDLYLSTLKSVVDFNNHTILDLLLESEIVPHLNGIIDLGCVTKFELGWDFELVPFIEGFKKSFDKRFLNASMPETFDVFSNNFILANLINLYENFGEPKADYFATKGFSAFLSALKNLNKKELSDSEIEKIQNFLKLNRSEIYYLNYYIADRNNCFGDEKLSKLAFKAVKPYLVSSTPIAEEIKEIITDKFFYKYDSYNKDEKGKTRIAKEFLYSLISCLNFGNACEENVLFFLQYVKNSGIYGSEGLFLTSTHKYLLEPKYYDMLDVSLKRYLLLSFIEKAEDIHTFSTLHERGMKDEIDLLASYQRIFDKAVHLGLFDIKDYKRFCSNDSYFTNALRHIKDKCMFSNNEYLSYLLDFYNVIGIKDIPTMFVNLIWNENSNMYYYREQLLKEQIPFETLKYVDDAILHRYLQMEEDLLFAFYPNKYANIMYERLNNDLYLHFTGIACSDVEILQRDIYSNKDVYKNFMREIFFQELKNKFTSDEDKRIEEYNLMLNSIETCDSLYYLNTVANDESLTEPEFAELILKKLKELSTTSNRFSDYKYKIIYKLAVKELINKDIVYDLFMYYKGEEEKSA